MKEDRNKQQALAEQALHEKNYQLANELFSELYSEKKSARKNFFLVQSLAGLQDYCEALEVAQEYMKSYLAEDERLVFYIHVAVFAGEALKVYELLESLKSYMTKNENQLFYSTLSCEVALFNEQEKANIEKLKKKLRYLGALSPLEQQNVAKKASALSDTEFIAAVKEALLDENVHALVRSSFLNDLRLLNVEEEITYKSFLNGKSTILPFQLKGLQQTEVFKHYAAQILGNTSRSPNLSQQIFEEITLKLMILYPDLTDVEKDRDLWYHIFLNDQAFLSFNKIYGQVALKLEKTILEWSPHLK